MRPTFLFLMLLSATAQAQIRVEYTIEPVPPAEGRPAVTHVTAKAHGVPEGAVRFRLANWSPGDYSLQPFAKSVQNPRSPQGVPEHPDADTWVVTAKGGTAELKYDISNMRAGHFSENAIVAADFAFYNPVSMLMFLEGSTGAACTLKVVLPEGWTQTACPLPIGSDGSYRAADFDTLGDSPLLAGRFAARSFEVLGRPFRLLFFRRHSMMDYDSFVPPIKRIAEQHARTMGGLPFDRYDIFFDAGGPGGGLEHLNAHRLAVGSRTRPEFVLGGISHELFHAWNIKRIRPKVLGPFDYITPPKTSNLWFAEGVTSYYGDLALLRSGLYDRERYLAGLGFYIGAELSNTARRSVSAEESSLRVWESGTSEGFGGVSYYLTGAVAGLALDLKIRTLTDGKKSLDDVMRDLMQRHNFPNPGYAEDGIREACIRAGGPEMAAFYDRCVRSTLPMPVEEALSGIGLRILKNGAGVRVEIHPDATPKQRSMLESWLKG
jgi:predicted metalloprotease with PDZ domain